MEQKKVNISVKELVDFSVGAGSIEKRSTSILSEAAWEGTQQHSRYQKEMEKKHPGCFAREITVFDKLESQEISLTVTGRIDGILEVDGTTFLYELKTTAITPENISRDHHDAHWGQAECYGAIHGKKHELETLVLRLVYMNRNTGENQVYEKKCTVKHLEEIYHRFIFRYLHWITRIRKWEILRNHSIRALDFPFPSYREGQKELAVQAYLSIKEGNRLFIQAPTGIGKTVGVLFPAIKALGEGLVDRIFYLTAKTVTVNAAMDTYRRMCEQGLNLRILILTAKDKMCPHEVRNCDPTVCDYADGYYQRAGKALKELLRRQVLDRETLLACAMQYKICPFELSLDACLYSDLIVCDYNYLFDPRIRLQRFFSDVDEKYCFLVDEAHNLVERGREMHSACIRQSEIQQFRKDTPLAWRDLRRRLSDINKALQHCKTVIFDAGESGQLSQRNVPEALLEQVKKCAFIMDRFMTEEKDAAYEEQFSEMLYKLLFFSKVSEFYDSRYTTFYILENNRLDVKLMCMDPSFLLSKSMDLGRSTLLFSATMEPMEYYRATLGARKEDRGLSLSSPFPRENLRVIVEGRISTKFRDRCRSYGDLALLIQKVTGTRQGNYMIYFPSYQYMKDVLAVYLEMDISGDVLIQKPSMSEEERESFLERFQRYGETTLTGFAVMGGIFGEGIDLIGDRLSGVMVVGAGLPAVCAERELIREYFDENEMNGFDYAYTFPGMNRVLQASGRVIRTEEDRGFIILVDSRFPSQRYRRLLPSWWEPEFFTQANGNIHGSASDPYRL